MGKVRTAIVTGASSGIGRAVAQRLVDGGIRVYGFGRSFEAEQAGTEGASFFPVTADLTDMEAFEKEIQRIRKQEEISILINNAGIGYFGLHEELNRRKIHEMVAVNLEAPLLASQLLLRDLKKRKGFIINISSAAAKKQSPHGCAYGATKSALTAFSLSLFEEARKYGVKVTAIHPDMTRSQFYRNADFKEADGEDTCLAPEELAQAVWDILNCREGLCVPELALMPQKHRIEKKK